MPQNPGQRRDYVEKLVSALLDTLSLSIAGGTRRSLGDVLRERPATQSVPEMMAVGDEVADEVTP